MNATTTTATSYNSPWPMAIIAWFVVFAIFLVTFIVWAVHQREDLVASNYYETEIRYQQQLDRMKNSDVFAGQTVVTFDPVTHQITITLPAGEMQHAVGSIHLYRPSDARLDRNLPLSLDGKGMQQLDTRPLQDGLWKVRLEWNANGRGYYLDRSVNITAS